MDPDLENVDRMADREAIEEAKREADRYYLGLLNSARLYSRDGIATADDVQWVARRMGNELSGSLPNSAGGAKKPRKNTRWMHIAIYLAVVAGVLMVASAVAALVEGGIFAARFGTLSSVVVALSAFIGVAVSLLTWLINEKLNRNSLDRDSLRDYHSDFVARLDGMARTGTIGIDREAHYSGKFLVRWHDVEKSLRGLASRTETDWSASSLPNGEVIRRLRQSGAISDKQNGDIREVLSVRNRLVHMGNLTDRELKAAIELADSVLEDLG